MISVDVSVLIDPIRSKNSVVEHVGTRESFIWSNGIQELERTDGTIWPERMRQPNQSSCINPCSLKSRVDGHTDDYECKMQVLSKG